MRQPEDVIPHLGKGPLHWKEGRSAHALANHWWKVNALPSDVAQVLATARQFDGAELVDAFFERDTSLGDAWQGSQTDLLAILSLPTGGLAVMGVEAKVDETFGRLIAEELRKSLPSSDKKGRIERLSAMLGLDRHAQEVLGSLRYQLLHRTAAALFEAERYQARTAVMLVETFSANDAHWDDFRAFAEALGGAPAKGALCEVSVPGEIGLWLGWCNSASRTVFA